jgi:hypothetical protein
MTAQKPLIDIRRQPDGTWTVAPQPPLAATTAFLRNGWTEIAQLRAEYGAIDHFDAADFEAFVAQYGPPPDTVTVVF